MHYLIPRASKYSNIYCKSVDVLPSIFKTTVVGASRENSTNVLQGKKKSARGEMFWQRRLDKGARMGHWKWVESTHGNGLFDLRTDLNEKHDLSKEKPKVLEMIKTRFAHWKKEMEAAEPRGPFRDY